MPPKINWIMAASVTVLVAQGNDLDLNMAAKVLSCIQSGAECTLGVNAKALKLLNTTELEESRFVIDGQILPTLEKIWAIHLRALSWTESIQTEIMSQQIVGG